MATNIHRTIDAVWRIESARVIAGLARIVRDLDLAEELAQDALVAALEQWPESGIPNNPAAWLMASAKHRALDVLRRRKMLERKHEQLQSTSVSIALEPEGNPAGNYDMGDDLLPLIFTACHPVLSREARVALTLRLLGGLTADEIARAFLVRESTIAQRIVRAKRTIADNGIPFEVPAGPEREARVSSVLEVIYLIFNEGYSATEGAVLAKPGLCEDALRLGRILAHLMPREPEVLGLVALMEVQASRLRARVDGTGNIVPLAEQDRTRWDRLLIRRGLAALAAAARLGRPRGVYVLQASIAACHATALTVESADWERIAGLYRELVELTGSPVVELNRAVAVAMLNGPAAGLAIADVLAGEASLASYHLLPSVRGDLLSRLERHAEAEQAFQHAASLTRNQREREFLLARAERCRLEAAPRR